MKTNENVQFKSQSQNFVRKFATKPALALKPVPKPLPPVNPQLNAKDLEILQMVLEMRYMNLRQVTKKFFVVTAGVERSAVDAIRRFIDLGLLKTRDAELGSDSLLVPTLKAYSAIAEKYPESKLPQMQKNIFQPRVKHDLLLNDLRIRFEELGFLNKWYSETMVEEIPFFKGQFADLPDAVCKKKNEKGYFLELEVSMKSPKVYSARIAEYLKILALEEIKDAGIEGAVFFCTDEKVRDKIKEQIPEGVKNISVLLYDSYFQPRVVADEK